MKLDEKIMQTNVAKGEIALFYLAQAGFCLKTAKGTLAGIDLYLSDCCETMFGFKRLIPAPIQPNELDLDILASTHSHADHLDPEALSVFANNPKTFFVGAPDCRDGFRQAGIADVRCTILTEGNRTTIRDIEIRAVYADHGELAPDAVGLIFCVDGITIYNTGDTTLRPEKILVSLGTEAIDVMIAPINGAFGNLTVSEACDLAAIVKPRIFIASHFGMFAEHGSTGPKEFLECSRSLPSDIIPVVMTPGEMITISTTDK
jgi:L-ascorbate 6-phosphate lactonase